MCSSALPSKKTRSGAKEEDVMEGFVAKQVHDYQTGQISRRRLIEILTLAATTAAAGRAGAAEQRGVDVALVNHVSYTCPDFRKAADWYSMVFNLDQVGPTARDVALPFGKKGEKPYGVTASDVPLTHLIFRTRPANAPPAGGQPRRTPTAVVDHLAYTVADFKREDAKARLNALGCKNVRDGGPFSVYVDDPFGYVVQIGGLDVTAICGAEARAGCEAR
jgi:catechol 2,3-dioxygenase-like lactoylglutathione lyase family enzyme